MRRRKKRKRAAYGFASPNFPDRAAEIRSKGGIVTAMLKNNADSLFTKADTEKFRNGGRKAHANGNAQEWDSTTARAAIKKRWAMYYARKAAEAAQQI